MQLIQDKSIAIIGGGPGGLTLARLLQIKGANVKVYERDFNRHARVQGATLDLHEESGLEALLAAGLIEAFWANYRPGAGLVRVMDKHANIMFDEHGMETPMEEGRPEIDRGPLREILLDSLRPGTVMWNSQFVSMRRMGDGWVIDFKNGNSAYADIVIGADGANSKIRPYVTPLKPWFVGVTAMEGYVHNSAENAPQMHALLNGGKIFAFGDEQSLIVSAKGDGSLAFYTGCKTSEDWVHTSGINFNDKAQVTTWFKTTFAGWHEAWVEMFENAEPVFIPRPQYCIPLDQHWQTQPNITLLGDAAHLIPPYAGEGVNMAMLDALELSICLTSDEFIDMQAALCHHEKNMHARMTEIAQQTLDSTDLLHSPQAISGLLEMFGQAENIAQ